MKQFSDKNVTVNFDEMVKKICLLITIHVQDSESMPCSVYLREGEFL